MVKKQEGKDAKQQSDQILIPSFELKDLNDKKILSTLLGFINKLPYLIIVLDFRKERYKTLLINEKMAKSLGKTVENIIGRNITEFIPTARNKRVEIAKRMIDTKKAQFFMDQREDRVFYNEFYPHLDKQGKVEYGIAIVRDITEQKKEEQQKINEKEAYYESLIENSMDLITVVNKSGIILYTSPSIQKLLGYKPSRRIGKKIFEIIHPEDLSSFTNYFNGMLTHPKLKNTIIFRIKDKKGTWHHFETIINNQIQNSEINGLIINSRDITKRFEQEREKNAILDSTSEIISYHDINHNIIWANKAYQKQTGLSLKELKGKKCYHAWGLDRVCAKCPISKALQTGKPHQGIMSPEQRKSWPSDYKTWLIKGDPVLDQDGNIIGAIELSYDITDRQKADEEIKRTKEQLEKLVNSAHELIFSVDKNYKITLWNQSAENFTGLKTTNMLGKDIRKITHFENANMLSEFLKNRFQGNISTIDKIEMNTLFGSKRTFGVSTSIIKDKDEKTTDVVFICKDITLMDVSYGQLIAGQSYLINDPEISSTLLLFNFVLGENKKGVLITRSQYENVIQHIDTKQISIAILSSHPIPKVKTIANLSSLKTYIKTVLNKDNNSIICLTRVDYLFTIFGFEPVLTTLYEINDIIRKNQAILLLQINNQLLNEKEVELLKEEYLPLPSKQIKEIYLDEKLIKLLSFIYEQNQSNLKAYQKNICNQLHISKVTAQKRIDDLIAKGLVFSKKQGRIKNLHITEKGKEFLKRQG